MNDININFIPYTYKNLRKDLPLMTKDFKKMGNNLKQWIKRLKKKKNNNSEIPLDCKLIFTEFIKIMDKMNDFILHVEKGTSFLYKYIHERIDLEHDLSLIYYLDILEKVDEKEYRKTKQEIYSGRFGFMSKKGIKWLKARDRRHKKKRKAGK